MDMGNGEFKVHKDEHIYLDNKLYVKESCLNFEVMELPWLWKVAEKV